MTANDIRACFREHYKYRFREVGLFEFGINDKVFDAFIIMPDGHYFKGFEFKASRSDYLSDIRPRERIEWDFTTHSYVKRSLTKWGEYLKYCHVFYFVCPEGLIKPEEVEAPAGLLWIGPNPKGSGFSFRIAKKPKRVNKDMSIGLQQRILFFFASRAKDRNQRYF